MPKIELIKMRFSTPLHIANERDDYSGGSALLHNDAFTAAVYFMWNRMGHSDWIPKNVEENAGFVFSSLYPFQDNGNQGLYFVPKLYLPASDESVTIELDTISRKKLKKVKWIEWGQFTDRLQGKDTLASSFHLNGDFSSSLPFLKKVDKSGNSIDEAILTSEVYPRSAVSRTGNEDTVIFYIERFFFGTGAGLYAFVQYDNEQIKKRVEAAIRLLGDEGIGTDRNVGNGKFVPEFDVFLNYPEIENPQLAINLGLYCPTSKIEFEALTSSKYCGFNLVKRTGWLSEPYNSWRKKKVYMIAEGGSFQWPNHLSNCVQVIGKIVDLRPEATYPKIEHPIYRTGKSFFFPAK